jgi:hypothetical protein
MLSTLKLIFEIIRGLLALKKFIEDNKREQWFQDVTKTFGDFKQKTPEERKALAKNIGDLLRNL